MPLATNLRVGVVGLTHPHALLQLRGLELMDDVEKIYVAEPDEELLAQVKDRPKVAGTFTDARDVLRRDDVLIVLVMARNDQAATAIETAIAAGKHVMAEKPAARTAAEMARIVDTAARKNVQVSVCYSQGNHPQFAQATRLRAEGALGRLMSAEMRMVTTSVALRNPRRWLFQKAAAGGGILHWLGCNEIMLLREVTGEEVTAVSAMTATLGGEAIDVEDVATVLLQLSGGALATLHTGYMLVGGRPGYSLGKYDPFLGIRGTLGRIWTESTNGEDHLLLESLAPGWDHAERHTFAYRAPQVEPYSGADTMDFMRRFFHAALRGHRPAVTAEDALRVLQIVEAAYESADTGRVVTL